jgi:Family of unknown function (DUF6603)
LRGAGGGWKFVWRQRDEVRRFRTVDGLDGRTRRCRGEEVGVCMVGGLLAAVLDAGPLGASFSAHADLLINYQPFHFIGTAGVEIGVQFTMDLFICTLHISVDIAAELTMYGPPFGGDVWVDFWVFGFSIHFGDAEQDAPILDILGFQTLLEQQQDGISAQPTAHLYAVEKGRYVVNKSTNNTDSPPGAGWTVKSQGFSFRVQSRFAIETSSCNRLRPQAAID